MKNHGRYSSKDNRIIKLQGYWSEIESQMIRFIERGHGLTEKARCAYAILLMMETGIRVGNESSADGYICDNKYLPEYGKKIKTYGLTTLTIDHVKLAKNKLSLQFVGKKSVAQNLSTSHPILLTYYPRIASRQTSTFLDIDYRTLYSFVKKSIGKKFKPKDIRTVVVNNRFEHNLGLVKKQLSTVSTKRDGKAILRMVIEKTAQQIGHTPGCCKSSYISKKFLGDIQEKIQKIVNRNKERNKRRKK